jgi:hypothetical protein
MQSIFITSACSPSLLHIMEDFTLHKAIMDVFHAHSY